MWYLGASVLEGRASDCRVQDWCEAALGTAGDHDGGERVRGLTTSTMVSRMPSKVTPEGH
jgi:hypothetical protein